jgi:hypothetical protein
MLSLYAVKRILLAQWRVDFRKNHLGLLGECRKAGLEPWNGDCVVFVSKCKTKLKMLIADDNGLWIHYKHFSKGTMATKLAFLDFPTSSSLSQADLAMLIDGNGYTVTNRKQKWKPSHLDNN